jgi:hypothetical protein
MSGRNPDDVGHDNPVTGRDLIVAASAAFYDFAGRCMDWAKTTRSLQERAIYTLMGVQWLAAGAQLQTFLQVKALKNKETKEAITQEALPLDTSATHHDRLGSITDISRDPA